MPRRSSPNSAILKKSVRKNDFNETPYQGYGGIYQLTLPFGQPGSGDLPPYWSPARDRVLKTTPMREAMWASAIGIASSKVSASDWKLDGRKVKYWHDLILSADNNQSFVAFQEKQIRDYLLTDNGCHFEIVRTNDAAGARIIGIQHLPSWRVIRTGDESVPVIYCDRFGVWHEMKYYQVVSMADEPDSDDFFFGTGHCLNGDMTVEMADGSRPFIKDLVKNKVKADVVTLLPDGSLGARPITGWHENSIGDRTWVIIRGEKSFSRSLKSVIRLRRGGLQVTSDHPILTPSGYKPAIEIENGDEFVTSFPAPNRKQMEFLVGSILGDGSINIGKNRNLRPRFSMGHSVEQKEWFNLKGSLLSEFGWSSRENGSLNGQTSAQPSFIDLKEQCYPNSKKNVPSYILQEYISPLLLATWYLDDGWIRNREENERGRNPVAFIGNSGASKDNTEELVAVLNHYGYECKTISSRGSDVRKDIYFTVNGSKKLFNDIAPYVPESMRYKIPNGLSPFNSELWNLGKAGRFVDRAIVEHRVPRKDHPKSTVYCLDVEETHNFVSSNTVVHNCAASRAWSAIMKLSALELYVYEKISGKQPSRIYLANANLNETQFQNAMDASKERTNQKGYVVYQDAIIIPILDPSANASVSHIDLKGLPENFEAEKERIHAMLTYANAIGIDPVELDPNLAARGRALGSGSQAQVLDDKQSGKGLISFFKKQEYLINEYILPDRVTFYFGNNDLVDRTRQATIFKTHAETVRGLIGGGQDLPIITPEQGKQVLVELGDIPPDFLIADLTDQEQIGDTDKIDVLEVNHQKPIDSKLMLTKPKPEPVKQLPDKTNSVKTGNGKSKESLIDVWAEKAYNDKINRAEEWASERISSWWLLSETELLEIYQNNL